MAMPDEYTYARSTRFYVRIFLGLALVAGAEILAVLFVPFRWLRAVILLSLAAV